MIDSFVTRCPHCATSFRVTRAQLGTARGAVRCGACMQVFNAGQQLLVDQPGARPMPARPAPASPPVAPTETPPRPAATAPRPAAAPVGPAAGEPLWIHDDLDLSDLDLDEELARLEQQERQEPRLAHAPLGAPRTSAASHDESWADALLEEPARPAAALRVEHEEPQEPAEARLEPSLGAPAADHEAEHEPPLSPLPLTDSEPPRRQARLRDDSLAELTDEPLRFDSQRPKKPWGRIIAWSLANGLALLVLGGQYVAYHFDELARQDKYRPWFAQLCPEIGCALPSKVDISLIKSSNLVVRSHPEFAGALVVDAILYNRATFAQPFPLLEMRFADMNGKLLASRRFKPAEYLAGELAGQAEMPPQTPIHIALDILDPGPKAVNYSLGFHSPE